MPVIWTGRERAHDKGREGDVFEPGGRSSSLFPTMPCTFVVSGGGGGGGGSRGVGGGGGGSSNSRLISMRKEHQLG